MALPDSASPTPATPRPLLSAEDVRRELHRLFDGGDAQLVIRIAGADAHGAEDDAVVDTFHEMLESLRMHGGEAEELPDLVVAAPGARAIAKGLRVLSEETLQKELLDTVLTTFGRALIDPIAAVLDRGPDGELLERLRGLRQLLLEDVEHLPLTPETRDILAKDALGWLNDDYLAMLAEHEETVQRPRAEALAQDVLRLLGDTFHAALASWPGHAEQIAHTVAHKLAGEVTLRDVPAVVREQIVDGVEQFLWVETSSDLRGALRALFGGYADLVPEPPALERRDYRAFAEACWRLVAQHA